MKLRLIVNRRFAAQQAPRSYNNLVIRNNFVRSSRVSFQNLKHEAI
jgi:hypothetical protein